MSPGSRLARTLLLFAVLGVTWPELAHADEASVSVADTLFVEGRKLMKEEKWEEAIPKLVESHRLVPRGGTVLNLAICYHKVGKTASAHAKYKEALAYAVKDKNAERQQLAEQALAEIAPKLSRLTIRVRPDAQVEGLRVTLDGQPIEKPVWGTPFPVDPGERVVVVTGKDKVPWEKRVTVAAANDDPVVEVSPLADAPKAKVVPPPPGKDGDPATGNGQRAFGYVVGTLGILGLGVGSFYGVSALSAKKKSDDHCPADRCDADGAAYSRDATRFATLSTVGFAVGIVAVGVGTALVLTAPSTTKTGARGVEVTVAIGPGSLSIAGAF